MHDQSSLLKARYCLAVLKTASISPDAAEARHLIESLGSEVQTNGTSAPVAEAEGNALSAIKALVTLQAERHIHAGSTEWIRARKAIENWVAAAS